MPNHVTNMVEIKGNADKLSELESSTIKTKDGTHSFDFNGIVPMPDHIFTGDLGQSERENYGKDNWYDWSIDNWGTKWNAYDFSILHREDGRLVVQFDTAWSTPTPIFEKLVEMGFEVNVMWLDEGGPQGDFGDPWNVFEHQIVFLG